MKTVPEIIDLFIPYRFSEKEATEESNKEGIINTTYVVFGTVFK